MVETKNLMGVVALLTMLLGFGGGVMLSQEQSDNAYVCPSNDEVGVFDRLSSTGRTGYWVDENGANRKKLCGLAWVPLKDFTPTERVLVDGCKVGQLCYTCGQEGCVEV